ncbi:MAG TPA: hypothetical protein VGL86_14435, partial [Polyangia bacterium]
MEAQPLGLVEHVGQASPAEQHRVVALAGQRRGRVARPVEHRGGQVFVAARAHTRAIADARPRQSKERGRRRQAPRQPRSLPRRQRAAAMRGRRVVEPDAEVALLDGRERRGEERAGKPIAAIEPAAHARSRARIDQKRRQQGSASHGQDFLSRA